MKTQTTLLLAAILSGCSSVDRCEPATLITTDSIARDIKCTGALPKGHTCSDISRPDHCLNDWQDCEIVEGGEMKVKEGVLEEGKNATE